MSGSQSSGDLHGTPSARRTSDPALDTIPQETVPRRNRARIPGVRAVTISTGPLKKTQAATSPNLGPDSAGLRRFEMGSEIGRGGLGAVFSALDPNLNRSVAIKRLLRPQEEADKRSFLEEAQIAGQLEHPNVVPIYELGFDEDSHPYLAMKQVEGRTLADAIDETDAMLRRYASSARAKREAATSSALRELLRSFMAVCDAMDYAHDREVIHRDLKPSNILLGDYGEVLVTDWGLAKVLSSSGERGRAAMFDPDDASAPMIQDAVAMDGSAGDEITYVGLEAGGSDSIGPDGTLDDEALYTADAPSKSESGRRVPSKPRRTRSSARLRSFSDSGNYGSGRNKPIRTSRSESADDHTIVGAIFGTPTYMAPEQARGETHRIGRATDVYALGSILYSILTGSTPYRGSTAEVLNAVRAGRYIPLSEHRRRRAIPRELAAVTTKAMSGRIEDRYETVGDLKQDVEAWIDGRTISAAAYTPIQLMRKWAKRNKAFALTVSAVSTLLLTTVFVFVTLLTQETERARASADMANDQSRRAEAAAQEAIKLSNQAEAATARAEAETMSALEARNALQGALYDGIAREAAGSVEDQNYGSAMARVAGLPGLRARAVRLFVDRPRLVPLGVIEAPRAPFGRAAFHETRGWIGTIDGADTIRIYDVSDPVRPALLREWQGPRGREGERDITFSPDGRRMATAHRTRVIIWDTATGEQITELSLPQTGPENFRKFYEIYSLAWSPDGRILAVSQTQQVVYFFAMEAMPIANVPQYGRAGIGGTMDYRRGDVLRVDWLPTSSGNQLLFGTSHNPHLFAWGVGDEFLGGFSPPAPFSTGSIKMHPEGALTAIGSWRDERIAIAQGSEMDLHDIGAVEGIPTGLAWDAEPFFTTSNQRDPIVDGQNSEDAVRKGNRIAWLYTVDDHGFLTCFQVDRLMEPSFLGHLEDDERRYRYRLSRDSQVLAASGGLIDVFCYARGTRGWVATIGDTEIRLWRRSPDKIRPSPLMGEPYYADHGTFVDANGVYYRAGGAFPDEAPALFHAVDGDWTGTYFELGSSRYKSLTGIQAEPDGHAFWGTNDQYVYRFVRETDAPDTPWSIQFQFVHSATTLEVPGDPDSYPNDTLVSDPIETEDGQWARWLVLSKRTMQTEAWAIPTDEAGTPLQDTLPIPRGASLVAPARKWEINDALLTRFRGAAYDFIPGTAQLVHDDAGTLLIEDLATGTEVARLPGVSQGYLMEIRVHPNGRDIFVTTETRQMMAYRLQPDGSLVQRWISGAFADDIMRLGVSPDGQLLVGGGSSLMSAWSAETGEQLIPARQSIGRSHLNEERLMAISFAGDGRSLWVSGWERMFRFGGLVPDSPDAVAALTGRERVPGSAEVRLVDGERMRELRDSHDLQPPLDLAFDPIAAEFWRLYWPYHRAPADPSARQAIADWAERNPDHPMAASVQLDAAESAQPFPPPAVDDSWPMAD